MTERFQVLLVSTLADRGIPRLHEGVLIYPWNPENIQAAIQESLQRVKQMDSVLITYVDNPLRLSQTPRQRRIAGTPGMQSRAPVLAELANSLKRTGRRGADETGEPGHRNWRIRLAFEDVSAL